MKVKHERYVGHYQATSSDILHKIRYNIKTLEKDPQFRESVGLPVASVAPLSPGLCEISALLPTISQVGLRIVLAWG